MSPLQLNINIQNGEDEEATPGESCHVEEAGIKSCQLLEEEDSHLTSEDRDESDGSTVGSD